MLWLAIKFVLALAFMAALLFWPAGTLDWPGAWIFLGEMLAAGVAITLWLRRHNPALLRERMGNQFQKETVFGDKVLMSVLQITWSGWFVLMGFDAKHWHLSQVPVPLESVGAILIALFFFISWLTFRENPFAAPVVKIQKERGQTVITTGPYRFVRHPMYAGAILYFIGVPLLLGSWIGLTCAPLLVGALMIRIGIEERALRKDLAGYSDYAARVRYRLLPYVW